MAKAGRVAAQAVSRDPRLRPIASGVPRVSSASPGRVVTYTGRAPVARSGASMMRYSGHTNPLAKR